MKALLDKFMGQARQKPEEFSAEGWFKALSTILRHMSHLSPTMTFETFSRHITDALCQGLAPLGPVAAHFHIDVSTSHLWLPDPSFRIDSFFRIQNRILMNSQSRPVETSREDLNKTICTIPYELHQQAIEIVIYHSEDARPFQGILAPILEGCTRSITQSLKMREDYLHMRMSWEQRAEKVLGSRLAEAIHQVHPALLFAQNLRAFRMPSVNDGKEHVFVSQVAQHDAYRALFLRLNLQTSSDGSSSRTVALLASLAAQLRLFENAMPQASFSDLLQHFGNSLMSLSHLITLEDEICFALCEMSVRSGLTKWHSAGLPPPSLFGRASDTTTLPALPQLKPFRMDTSHDWHIVASVVIPPETGLIFLGNSVLTRLTELNISESQFFERLRGAGNAAQMCVEAERMLSTPDPTRVVAASVTDWKSLPYDLTFVCFFNSGARPMFEPFSEVTNTNSQARPLKNPK